MKKNNETSENQAQCAIQNVSCWVRCSDCKHLKHKVRLGNSDGDILGCTQDSNENTFINNRNIYEEWHCDVFEHCS